MIFIFDENYPVSLVQGLALLENANKHSPIPVTVIDAISFMGKKGAPDIDIIQAAANKDAVIITHDSDFKRIKHYKPILIQSNVGYIYFRVPKGGYHYWDIVKSFIVKWEDLKKEISKDTHPFAYEISKKGEISKCHF